MRSSRVLGYGLGVWVGMVAISLVLLPAEGKHEALYESVKLTTMTALVLGLTIRYLRRRPDATGPEGVLVGLVWAAVTTAGDLGLYLGGAFNIGLDVYFTDVASSYAVMPVITGLAMGFLAPGTATEPTAAARLAAAPTEHLFLPVEPAHIEPARSQPALAAAAPAEVTPAEPVAAAPGVPALAGVAVPAPSHAEPAAITAVADNGPDKPRHIPVGNC